MKSSSSILPKFRTRPFTACPQIQTPFVSVSVSTPIITHQTHCLSLLERLISQGFLSSAQQVVRKIIYQSSNAAEAISAVDFASIRGMVVNSGSLSVLISKLVGFDETLLAKRVFDDCFLRNGVGVDSSVLNDMVVCCCALGDIDEGKEYFDKLVSGKFVLSRSACDGLIRGLCKKDRFLEAFEYFVTVNDGYGVLLGLRTYSELIKGLCFEGCFSEAVYVYDEMREKGVKCKVSIYKLLFYSLCKIGCADDAVMMCTDMELEGLYIDKVMYTSLISAYCKAQKMKTATLVFFKMMKMACEPDSYTYNTLINGYFNIGMREKGWFFYEQMVGSGIKPNAVTYHSIIRMHFKEGKADSALSMFDSMRMSGVFPNVYCYTSLVSGLLKEKLFEKADLVYHEMLRSEIVPDHVLLFTLMKYSVGAELELALMLLHKVAEVGCGLDSSKSLVGRDLELEIEILLDQIGSINPKLRAVAYGMYMLTLCEIGKPMEAFICLEKMISLEIQPLLSTYNSLIKCLCEEGLVEEAKSFYERMLDEGIVPNMATYLVMVAEHCKRNDIKSAFDVLDEMNDIALKPSPAIYDAIVGCLSRQERICEAEVVFKEMLEAGVDPDEVIYVTMINAYSKNGRAARARQLFEKMVKSGIKPSSRAYTALIHGLVKENMSGQWCLYLRGMLDDGIAPNNVFYTSLLNQFLRKKELEFALRLVCLMEYSQIEHDLVTCITLVSGVSRNIAWVKGNWFDSHFETERGREMLFHLLRQNSLVPRGRILRISRDSREERKTVAFRLFDKIKETKFMPNLYLYNGIIYGLCLANKIQEAYDHVELLQMDGLIPNQVTFTILIAAHIRLKEIDCAVWLFNYMSEKGYIPERNVYNTLIKGLCKNDRLLDALTLSQMMAKRGLFPCKVSYEYLLGSLCDSHFSSDAYRICEEMVAHDYIPCEVNYNALLCLLLGENRRHEIEVINQMIRAKEIMREEKLLT